MEAALPGTNVRKSSAPVCAIILGSLFALALITLIVVAVVQKHAAKRNTKYGIVLDAGSSHTNVYVYEWPAEKENDTGVVYQVDVCEVEGPGISAYANDVEKAGASLKQCMDKAKASVPSKKRKNTPVYLGATAGMRLLSLQNKDASEKVLSAIQSTLQSYPFSYKGSRILSGQEEGAYGWITINYLMGNFKESIWPSFLPRIFSSPGTTGALDLGGASTQITFVPDKAVALPTDAINFHLYGNNYTVYTHSFLCYGKDQAMRLKLAIDAQGASRGFHIDPCYHRGYKKIVNISELLTNPCTAPNLQPPPSFKHFQLDGAGNYERCLASIQKIFNVSQCPYSNCAFNGIFMPPVTGNFGAFSAFYYVMDFLNVTNEPLEEVIQALKTFCATPWTKVKDQFPNIKEKYLTDYCFSGTYIVALLNERFSFDPEKWSRVHFLKKIASSDAGWTLGYMLNLTNMIPSEPPYIGPLSQPAFISLISVSTVLAVCLLLIGLMMYCKPKGMPKGRI